MLDRLRRSARWPARRALPSSGIGTLLVLAGCVAHSRGGGPPPDPSCHRAESLGGAGEAAQVRWHLPPEPADRERLSRWCAAVGPAVALSHPGEADAVRVDSLAVISWNAHVGGGDLAALVSDLRAGRLTDGEPVEHFVLLLQEVHRADSTLPRNVAGAHIPSRVEEAPPSGERRDIVAAARELGLSLYYVPSMRNGADAPPERFEDRGNAILSTLPLTRLQAIVLPFEAQRRVAAAVAIRGSTLHGEWELLLSSVHLDTRSTGTRLMASLGAGRHRQAAALVAGLPAAGAAVVAGDLNTWSLSTLESAVPLLRAHLPQTPSAPDEPTFSTGWGYSRRLDHMFFRLPAGWRARYQRVESRYGSDHHPLLGWVIPAGEPQGLPLESSAEGVVSLR